VTDLVLPIPVRKSGSDIRNNALQVRERSQHLNGTRARERIPRSPPLISCRLSCQRSLMTQHACRLPPARSKRKDTTDNSTYQGRPKLIHA
jgi:hypothetical protein